MLYHQEWRGFLLVRQFRPAVFYANLRLAEAHRTSNTRALSSPTPSPGA